jgi:hypothetical protein
MGFLFTNTCEIILERKRTKKTKKTTKETCDYEGGHVITIRKRGKTRSKLKNTKNTTSKQQENTKEK